MSAEDKVNFESEFDIGQYLEAFDSDNRSYLDNISKSLFDPDTPIINFDVDNPDDKMVNCVTGGVLYDDFKDNVKKYDTRNACDHVLSNQEFSFSCNTCGLLDGVLFCIECFSNGDHESHDYTISRCRGTCDCGLYQFMDETAFCDIHSEDRTNDMPDGYLKYLEFIVPHLIYRLIQYLRAEEVSEFAMIMNIGTTNEELYFFYEAILMSIDNYMDIIKPHFDFLFELSSSNESIRKIINKYLINEDFYQKKLAQDMVAYQQVSSINYAFKRTEEKCQEKLNNITFPSQIDPHEVTQKAKQFRHMLDEFIFWCMYLKTPEYMTKLLGNLLLDNDTKHVFFESFSAKYVLLDNAGSTLGNTKIRETFMSMSNLFFLDKKLCETQFKHSNILTAMVLHQYDTIHRVNMLVNDESTPTDQHQILNLNYNLLETFMFDIANMCYLLNYADISQSFRIDEALFSVWIEIISHLQGLRFYTDCAAENLDCDKLNEDLLEAIMWKTDVSNEGFKIGLNIIKESLFKWCNTIGMQGGNIPNKHCLTFDLPLHRYFSIYMFEALRNEKDSLAEMLPNDELQLLNLLAHPLQILVTLHKIHANVWTSLNDSLKQQRLKYIDNELFRPHIDFDLYLIQCLTCNLKTKQFLSILLEKFDLIQVFKEMIDLNESVFKSQRDNQLQKTELIYGFLVLISQLVTREISLALKERNSIKHEVIQMLSCDDCTHSTIEDKIYAIFSRKNDTNLQEILDEVADLKQPDYTISTTLKNSKYSLKGSFWLESYDPLYYNNYRSEKDMSEISFKQYCHYIRNEKLYKDTDKLWRPFRLPSNDMTTSKLTARFKILNSKILHSVLFVLLYRRLKTDGIDDKTFQLVIYLIEMAVHTAHLCDKSNDAGSSNHVYLASDFDTWFKSNNILDNLCETIPHVVVEDESKKTPISLNESIISLLVKILFKNHKDELKKFKFDEVKTSRIGDEFHFLTNLLSKAGKLNKNCEDNIKKQLKALIESVNEPIEKAAKRENSKLDDLVNGYAKKNFEIDQMSYTSVYESNQDGSSYYCSICRCSSSASLNHPIGLIGLITNTNIVGYFDCLNEKQDFVDQDSFNQRKMWLKEKFRLELLKEAFTSESCKYSVNNGFKDGVFVRTCGHYIHIECFSIMKNVKMIQTFFECPLCKQPANCILPVKNSSVVKYKKADLNKDKVSNTLNEESSEFILKTFNDNYVMNYEFVKKCLEHDNETLAILFQFKPQQYEEYEVTMDTPLHFNNSDCYLAFASMLRTQLEVNNLQSTNIKYSKSTRSCMLALFDILSTRISFLSVDMQPHITTWNSLTKSINTDGIKPKVPMLLRDPVTLFLLLISNWPLKISRLTFKRIVNSVFNLLYIQSMISAIFKMTPELKSSISNDTVSECKSFDDYMSIINSRVLDTSIQCIIDINNIPDVRSYIEQLCLPFLNIVSLFQSYLFDVEPDNMETYSKLTSHLEIGLNQNNTEKLLNWYESNPNEMVNLWLTELLDALSKTKEQVELLLLYNQIIYHKPEFIKLPEIYLTLFYEYLDKRCETCGGKSIEDDCICLFCGKYITDCCDSTIDDHKDECFAYFGVFLYVFSTNVYIYNEYGAIKWGSLYLDAYGEEDSGLRRGKALYLSYERYALLKQLWFNGTLQIMN